MRSKIFATILLGVAALVSLAGCRPQWSPKLFATSEALYRASLREYQRKEWENAAKGFEKLTTDLPARDTLLPRAHFYLGMARYYNEEYLLAAQELTRLTESFPDDTLSAPALLQAGHAYAKLWRKPTLDAQYGQTALSTYQTLLALYPNSPLRAKATAEVARLQEWFARKDYDAGMFYLRRNAFDPAIIYFKDIVRLYPNTPHVRDAELRLVDAYRAIRYKDDAAEVCTALRQAYPGDPDVRARCAAPDTAARTP
ncbi:MAG: hypothetical protein NVS4B3_18390 [Gemmatimonadaceae bacterium]